MPVIAPNKLRLELGPMHPVQVIADEIRISQVLRNLLSNAAKYTDATGLITVALRCEAADAVVTICDTGIGIPADQLETVFDWTICSCGRSALAAGPSFAPGGSMRAGCPPHPLLIAVDSLCAGTPTKVTGVVTLRGKYVSEPVLRLRSIRKWVATPPCRPVCHSHSAYGFRLARWFRARAPGSKNACLSRPLSLA